MTLGTAPNDVYQNGEWYNRAGRPLGNGETAIAVVSSRPSGRAQVGDVITMVQPDGQVLTSPGIFINKGAGYVSLAAATTFTLTASELPAEGTLWPIVARGTAGDGTVLESSPIYTGIQVAPKALTFPVIAAGLKPKDVVTVTAATFSGFPAPTVIRTYLLNGVVVWRGSSYTLPENSTNSILDVWETATNAVDSVTVAAGGVRVGAIPNVITPPEPDGLVTNYATRIYQMNAAFSSPRTVYNSAALIGATETDVTGTAMLITELEGEAESIQFLCANTHTVNTRAIVGCTAVCPSAIGDKKYDALFATAPLATFDGIPTATVPTATAGDTHAAMILSDEYPITTVPRTDGGTKPLLAIREAAFYPANNDTADNGQTNPASWSSPYFLHSGADWGDTSKPGFYLAAGVRDNKLNAAFTATPTGTANSPILGFRVKYKNRAATVIWLGSSFKKGDLSSLAAKRCSGFVMKSALAVSTPTRPIEFINCGLAGQQLIKARLAAEDIIPLVKPTHVVIECANPNDLSSVTTGTLNTLRTETNNIIAIAEANEARPMLDNGWARNSASLPNTAPYFSAPMEELLNSYLAEQQARGYPWIDFRTGMSAGTVPNTAKMIANGFAADYVISAAGDGLHQTLIAETEQLVPKASESLTIAASTYF